MNSFDFAMKLLKDGDVVVSPGGGFRPGRRRLFAGALVENENRLRQAVRQIGRCLGHGRPAAATRRWQSAAGGQPVCHSFGRSRLVFRQWGVGPIFGSRLSFSSAFRRSPRPTSIRPPPPKLVILLCLF